MTFNKKLKLCWLYYDLLELYGDRGNIKIFEKICIDNEIELIVDKITINDKTDISNYDILFLGGGSDYAQSLLYKDLITRKDQIQNFIENKGFILAICGGYQMFGKYYIGANGEKIEGLSFFDYYTDSSLNRCIGNVVVEDLKTNKKCVGFENHGGQTKNVNSPFARVLSGHGNEFKSEFEGYRCDYFLGTYLHGSLLPKNPFLASEILESIIKRKYATKVKINIDKLKYSELAHKIIVDRELKC